MDNSSLTSDRCPACERYIGPVLSCPYCDTDSAGGKFLVRLRIASFVLAVTGLMILLVVARLHNVPLRKIGDIGPAMNFAHVRISGTVKKPPYVSSRGDDGYMSFSLTDGTGSIRVAAYDDVAREIINKPLHAGSHVDIEGVLSIKAGRSARLIIRRSEDLLLGDERE